MLSHSKLQLQLAENANSKDSVFVLNALLTEVSSKVDVLDSEENVTNVVERMVAMSDQSNYVTQGQVMLALYMLSKVGSQRDKSLALVQVLEHAVIATLN